MEKSFACIVDNIVKNIVVFDSLNVEFIEEYRVLHSYDLILEATSTSEVYGEYDGEYFWRKKPYPSWLKNSDTKDWDPPISRPSFDPENPTWTYVWDEPSLSWVREV
jgi:hypothetical protein